MPMNSRRFQLGSVVTHCPANWMLSGGHCLLDRVLPDFALLGSVVRVCVCVFVNTRSK